MSGENNSLCKIRDFVPFLEKCLGQSVRSYTLKSLTKPGDNYGSVMLSVKVEIIDSNNEIKILHLVAKTAVTNPYLMDIFQPEVTFVKEAHFYSDVVPAMQIFQQMSNVPENERISNVFIRCYGSRLSLNPSGKADADAVLLFENIKLLNYKNFVQKEGFGAVDSLAIISQMAKFHSVHIAMKRLQPEQFDLKVAPFLSPIYRILSDDDTTILDNIRNGVRFIDNLSPKLYDAIEKQLESCYRVLKAAPLTYPDTPYTTVIHRDFWIANIMIKDDDIKDNPDKKIKIYDFQMYCLGSFVSDLIHFLSTSVRLDDLAEHFHAFINHYHKEFIKMMELLNCPLEDYTFEKMWCEIRKTARTLLLYTLFMVKIICQQSVAPSMDEKLTHDRFLKDGSPSDDVLSRWKLIIDLFSENEMI